MVITHEPGRATLDAALPRVYTFVMTLRNPLLLLLTASLAVFSFPRTTWADTVEIQAANGVYGQLGAQLQPIRQGPFTINVASPRHELKVHANRLDLQPGPGNTVDARFEVDLEGFGDLIADVLGPNDSRSHFEETVKAQRQRIRVAASMRLQKVPQGYLWTLLTPLTPTIDFAVESNFSQQLLGTCRALEVVPLLNLMDCGALKTALTTLKVPMPKAGTQWLVAFDRLTESERQFLDRFAMKAP